MVGLDVGVRPAMALVVRLNSLVLPVCYRSHGVHGCLAAAMVPYRRPEFSQPMIVHCNM